MYQPSFSRFMTTSIAAAVMTVMATQAHAEAFVAKDIAITGLQRVTIESLQTTLPIQVGQTVTDDLLADSIRALYATEQFSDVQSAVQDGQVVFHVTERPTIAEINFDGNKLIPKEGLTEGLKSVGLVVGNTLKQSTVHAIENELKNQYISQGYYNSDIKVVQTKLDGNRVKLDLKFIEGKPARVVDINIIGNQYFSDDDLKDEFIIKDKKLNPLSGKDKYTQDKFNASLEAIKAKYLNEGFVRFKINEATLNIDEDKQKISIELAIEEGQRYQFGSVNFVGPSTYSKVGLDQLITFKKGDGYSQAALNETTVAIANKFGDEGYYYAKVDPVGRINDETLTVDVDYKIDPERPIYVRRIEFNGNVKTKDEVLRREMRQLEGALSSNQKIALSRARLLRTGFFKDVQVNVRPVSNFPDQVDVVYNVVEQPSGSSSISAGYSQSGGLTFQFDLSQSNFMGTGNRLTAGMMRSESMDSYSLGLANPYFTKNGISQSVNAYYRKTKSDSKNISNYLLDSYGAALSYGYPINENQRINGGLTVDNTKVRGGRFMGISNVEQLIADGGKTDLVNGQFSKDYTTYGATLGWTYSTLDRPMLPTKGMNHDLGLTVGFGDKNYQKVVYRGNYYQPLYKGTILRGWAKLGYGNNLPFYENFYAGGYGSVRGYNASSLGPQSQPWTAASQGGGYARGEEVGGNAMASFGAELILPLPFKGDWKDQVRPVLFVDAGQVFDTTGRDKEYKTYRYNYKDPNDANKTLIGSKTYPLITQDKELRYSVGAGATWFTPIGPISISYAKPLNSKKGDQTDKVQFQIGSMF
ncbi:outer membrane protein assembly factor BamA [Moraxella nasovis]|uniref:outer membrane protein assembly factor BamA n=1 Tax=Moraxella nasovis TaxID=2904121 RepID=UPI001F60C83B|nr:outer membrane protein assembly factor BamA [Moraxella nasovis]UNU73580.1 outer membrane protein assembly factor BamA [Moraxella nasovis]